ncbi:DUF4142 domain-containing protein [Aureimonas psammosilenae]|uniref:DUF4142 domain-containing protein n=1 Tax=Aureimonas psammosilenae TaxID=2495496 RepID=UPI0012606161|nr:DUF4142 domain-containing protein [Aureimonas psammosilenae]
MKYVQALGIALAMSIPTVSFAQNASEQSATSVAMKSMTAKEYVSMAASSDMLEIASSKEALEKSKSDNVRKFAQQMITDHTMTTKEITAAAKTDDISVPKEMMPKHAEMLKQLQSAPAASFDEKYMQLQVMAHQEAVDLHSDYAQNGDDAALKAVATKAVPIVSEHLKHAQAMASKA